MITEMKWLNKIEARVSMNEQLPESVLRKLIAAVRLAEKTLAYQWSMPGTRARELKDTALARLRSGDVEEIP